MTYNGHQVVARRILVKLKRPPVVADLETLSHAVAATEMRPIGTQGWYLVDSGTMTVPQLAAAMSQNPLVAEAQADPVGHLAVVRGSKPGAVPRRRFMSTVPNDPYFPSQWALQNTGQTVGGVTGTPGADINAPEAWDFGHGSPDVVVADIGTGVDYSNSDLAANMWSAPFAYSINIGGVQYNCPAGSHGFSVGAVGTQAGCNGQETDAYGHDTAVAGIIGAIGNNSSEVAGVNWTTSIMSIRVTDQYAQFNGSDVVNGVAALSRIAVATGASVWAANISLSVSNDLDALRDEMTAASGVLFAASTGDDCANGARAPASFYLANELSVAASDQLDQWAYWSGTQCSNTGGDVAAPGKNVYTTIIGSTTPGLFNGTSASTPFVAGAIALLRATCPLPLPALKATIEGTADTKAALTQIATSGRRLNLGAALASCISGTAGTASITVRVYTNPSDPDTGSIYATIDGQTASVSYDTSQDTTDSVGENLAQMISGVTDVTAVYNGGGQISLTTSALGPYTGYTLSTGVNNDCGEPPNDCGRQPTITNSSFVAGHN